MSDRCPDPFVNTVTRVDSLPLSILEGDVFYDARDKQSNQ